MFILLPIIGVKRAAKRRRQGSGSPRRWKASGGGVTNGGDANERRRRGSTPSLSSTNYLMSNTLSFRYYVLFSHCRGYALHFLYNAKIISATKTKRLITFNMSQ